MACRTQTDFDAVFDMSGERCRCGLRLLDLEQQKQGSCNNCLDLMQFVNVGAPGTTEPAVPHGFYAEVRDAYRKFLAKRGLKMERLKPMRMGRKRC